LVQKIRQATYIRPEWCAAVIAAPIRKEIQADGRIKFWGVIDGLGGRVLRVVTLADGKTVHNAFPDRSFRRE